MIDGRADVFLEVICADVVCIHLRLSVIQRGAEIYSICLCIKNTIWTIITGITSRRVLLELLKRLNSLYKIMETPSQ